MAQTRCPNCMEPLNQGTDICPNCGYDAQTAQKSDALRANTVLQGKYQVGRELGRGKAGITYVGRDLDTETNVAIREYFPEDVASRDASQPNLVAWDVAYDEYEAVRRVEQAMGLELNAIMEEEGSLLRPADVLDAFQENGTAYLVADFAAGSRKKAMESAFAVSAGVMDGESAVSAESVDGASAGSTEDVDGASAGSAEGVDGESAEGAGAMEGVSRRNARAGRKISREGDGTESVGAYAAETGDAMDEEAPLKPEREAEVEEKTKAANSQKDGRSVEGSKDGRSSAAGNFPDYSDSGETIRAGDIYFFGSDASYADFVGGGNRSGGGRNSGSGTAGATGSFAGGASGGGASGGVTEPLAGGSADGVTESLAGGSADGVTQPLNRGSADGVTEPLNRSALSGLTEPLSGRAGNGNSENGEGNGSAGKAAGKKSGKKKAKQSTGGSKAGNKKNGKKGIIAAIAAVCVLAVAIVAAVLVYRSNTIGTLTVTTDPDTMTYYAGESFDPQGMELEVTYLSGKTETISGDGDGEVTFEPSTFADAGNIPVAIYYGKGSTELAVTVSDVEITLAGSSIPTMYVGDTTTMSVTTKPAGREVTWTSSDESVATVSEDGEITAVGEGEAKIVASTPSGGNTSEASCTVTVKPPSVSLSTDSLTISAGETARLTATVSPSGHGISVSFASSDTDVATVDQNGNVEALQAGTATVTATILWQGTTYEASCTVTVEKSQVQAAVDLAYESKEQAEAAQEEAFLAEDGASEAAEAAREAAETGETQTFTDGDVYQGEVNGTVREGYGIYVFSDGDYYVGEWEDDSPNGYGIYYWADTGAYYAGEWVDGDRDGYGSYYSSSGYGYMGQWSEDARSGYGVYNYSSGDSYAGTWADGNRDGSAVYTWSDGEYYAGEWADDKRNGYGIYYDEDGSVLYEGWWENSSYVGANQAEAEANVLMSDVHDNSDEVYNVFGSEYTNEQIVAVTFLSSLEDEPEDSWDVSNAGDGSVKAWVTEVGDGYHLYIAANGVIYAPQDCSGMFMHYGNCVSMEGLDMLDTSRTTDMKYMFYMCGSLKKLDVSGFDTSKVTNMNSMFFICDGLTELDVSRFDTSKVTDMSWMFCYCDGLTELDVSGFDTSRVTRMYNMFSSCYGLKKLDVSGFDTSKVTDMACMFENCESLKELDVSGFDTSQVTDMDNMFYGCKSLTELDLSGFDMSQVTEMEDMVSGCTSLTSLLLWPDISDADRESLYKDTGSSALAG